MRSSRRAFALLALLALAWCPGEGEGCPFCSMQGQTLSGEAKQAKLVLAGRLLDAREREDTTDLQVETVLKDHPVRAGRERLTLNRFLHLDLLEAGDRFLVFCDVDKGKLDAYRGMVIPATSKVPDYLCASSALDGKPTAERLRFFFSHLDSKDQEVANDAYKEFGNADYGDVRAASKYLDAARVARWLADPDTPGNRIGFHGLLLGHSGDARHAQVIRRVLDDPRTKPLTGVAGLLVGYTLLTPNEGWARVERILGDPSLEFIDHYAALHALRFFLDERPDVVGAAKLKGALSRLLEMDDLADLVIHDVRRRSLWGMTPRVLAWHGKPAAGSLIRRAVVDYARHGVTVGGDHQAACALFLARLKTGEDSPVVADRDASLPGGREAALEAAQIVLAPAFRGGPVALAVAWTSSGVPATAPATTALPTPTAESPLVSDSPGGATVPRPWPRLTPTVKRWSVYLLVVGGVVLLVAGWVRRKRWPAREQE